MHFDFCNLTALALRGEKNYPYSMVLPAVVREPLKFKAILQSKIWGGDGLHRILGKGDASDTDVGRRTSTAADLLSLYGRPWGDTAHRPDSADY